jgi:hypothetical protein
MPRGGRVTRGGSSARGRGAGRGRRGGRSGRVPSTANWSCRACGVDNSSLLPYCEACSTKRGKSVALTAPIKSDGAVTETAIAHDFFQTTALFPAHVAAMRSDRTKYFSDLSSCLNSGIAINAAIRARILAAAWAVGEKDAVEDMLALPDHFGVNEVQKALQLLDAPRASRRLSDKIERLRGKATAATIGALETTLKNVRAEMVPGERLGSVSRTLTKRLVRWASSISAATLEFYLLTFPTAPWKAVADLCHFKPGDFQLPYFLAACYDESAIPVDSLVGRAKALNAANLAETLTVEPRLLEMYSFVHKAVAPAAFTPEAKRAIVSGAPLAEVVWWFHELESPETVELLCTRLASGEALESARYSLNFGKVMERLLAFTERGHASLQKHLLPVAEAKLSATVFPPNDVRVAVLGDASGSMEVAVKTATILGGLLSCCLSADLVFFNHGVFRPTVQPRSAHQVVDVAHATRASGSTNPAAALREYQRTRRPIDIFIVVTDEEENQTSEGRGFAELFCEYRDTVHSSAQVFFCSFLKSNVKAGQMQVALGRRGVFAKTFVLNPYTPDLSKFDTLLGMIARLSQGFGSAPVAASSCGGAAGCMACDELPTALNGVTIGAKRPPVGARSIETRVNDIAAATLHSPEEDVVNDDSTPSNEQQPA